jgi:hypothetical protein
VRERAGEVWVQLATRIPKPLHREMRLYCVEAETSIMEFVIAALEEKLKRHAGRAEAAERARASSANRGS